VLGSIKSAQEHAAKIVEVIRETGGTDRAIYQGDLEEMHASLCDDLGWHHRSWHSIGRELVKVPGVVRGEERVNGSRLTFYEVKPAEVVALPVPERRRA
jgi:protein subunit release factor A